VGRFDFYFSDPDGRIPVAKYYHSIYESDPTGALNYQFVVSGSVAWCSGCSLVQDRTNRLKLCICLTTHFQRLNTNMS
jgi:hypothetical protein